MKVKSCAESPISATCDKYQEALYFLDRVVQVYHFPLEFRFNLNAFIQSLRNITFMLQSEDNHPASFANWYAAKQEEMKSDKLLRKFVESRNLIVKQGMLETKSKAFLGVFKYRKPKIGIRVEVSPFADSVQLIERARKDFVGFMIDEAHVAIGEEVGIEREWIVAQIGDEEIVSLCSKALNYMAHMVSEAHGLYGLEFEPMEVNPDLPGIMILLESDLDPSLPEKWGW